MEDAGERKETRGRALLSSSGDEANPKLEKIPAPGEGGGGRPGTTDHPCIYRPHHMTDDVWQSPHHQQH